MGTMPDRSPFWADEEFDGLTHQEDFSRPVHLKIFADIATNRAIKLKEFSVYELYDLATQETIGREMEKLERLPISGEKRGKFLEDVAWWLWEKDSGRTLNFNPYEVPTGIVRQVLSAEQQSTDEGLLRELFSGAFIERKFGDNFYFAHRSFLEFFVAKRLERSSREKLPLSVINAAINEEILSFLKSGKNIRSFIDYAVSAMARYAGELKLLLLEEISAQAARDQNRRSTSINQQHVDLILKVLPLYNPTDEEKALSTFITLLNEDLPAQAPRGAPLERAENAFYFIVDAVLFYLSKPAFKLAIEQVVVFLLSRTDFSFLRRSRQAGAVARNKVSRANLFEFMLVTFSNASATTGRDGPLIIIDFGRMFEDLRESRKPKITIANRTTSVEAGQFVWSMPAALIPLPPSDRELLLEVLRESSVF
jgi:hypothetical protein